MVFGRSSHKETEEEVPQNSEDFRIVLDSETEVVSNTGEILYEPLGIRSPGGVLGAKLKNFIKAYEEGYYEDTFLDIRRLTHNSDNISLGFIKLSIACHIRWWIGRGRIPSDGDKKRMKDAFNEAAKANTIVESYFSFIKEVMKEAFPEADDEELAENIRLYTGESNPLLKDSAEYSGLEEDGWYPMLSYKYLTRLPNTGEVLYKPLDLFCPDMPD